MWSRQPFRGRTQGGGTSGVLLVVLYLWFQQPHAPVDPGLAAQPCFMPGPAELRSHTESQRHRELRLFPCASVTLCDTSAVSDAAAVHATPHHAVTARRPAPGRP